MHANTLLGAVLLGAIASPSLAPAPDSWVPFRNQRVVSPSGDRYVVIRAVAARKVSFEYCARAPGATPIEPASYSSRKKKPEVSIDRDPADRLIAEGTVPQLPYKVMVPDGMEGFLLFDRYYSVGFGQVVTWIDGKGDAAVDLDLVELFGERPPLATATTSSLWWNHDVWIDADAAKVVVIAVGDLVREVAIPSGEVTEPGLDRRLAWIDRGPEAGRAAALDLLVRDGGGAVDRAAPRALDLFHDAAEPIGLRLRAAVLLAASGVKVNAGGLFLSAMDDAALAVDVRQYATEHLFDAIGAEAFPVLRERMRGEAGELWWSCIRGFARAGAAAVPTLVEMMAERDGSSDYRGGAAYALGEIGGSDAVPGLVAALGSGSKRVADAAAAALVANTSAEARAALIELLAAGSERSRQFGRYFVEHPGRDAIAALEKALADGGDERARPTLEEALAACRGAG